MNCQRIECLWCMWNGKFFCRFAQSQRACVWNAILRLDRIIGKFLKNASSEYSSLSTMSYSSHRSKSTELCSDAVTDIILRVNTQMNWLRSMETLWLRKRATNLRRGMSWRKMFNGIWHWCTDIYKVSTGFIRFYWTQGIKLLVKSFSVL